jgi:uncharacterized protein YceK
MDLALSKVVVQGTLHREAVGRRDRNRRRHFLWRWRIHACALLVVCSLCGCASVRPELTAEERAYNEQLKSQSRAALSTDDVLWGVLGGLLWYSQYALMAGGEALAGH